MASSRTANLRLPLLTHGITAMKQSLMRGFQILDASVLIATRQSVRAATVANITIATALNDADTLDGVTLADDDLVLVKNQTDPSENGVYMVAAVPARVDGFNTYDEHPGSLVIVSEGTANEGTLWMNTNNPGGVLDTTAINYSRVATLTSATQAAEGVVELATAAETITGTDAVRATHPAGVKAAIDDRMTDAANLAFDNTASTMTATDVQAAIDELAARVTVLEA